VSVSDLIYSAIVVAYAKSTNIES